MGHHDIDGVPSPAVKASSDGLARTRTDVNFSYLSFGFESASGKNQNAINIQCAVDLSITQRPMTGGSPCLRGPSYWCASPENASECFLDPETCRSKYGATW